MLGVDEGGDAAVLLGLGDDVQRQRRLARAFRPEDLDDAAARQTADAQRDVEAQRAGRDQFDLGNRRPRRSFITVPLPKLRSIWLSAAASALSLSIDTLNYAKRCGCCSHLILPYSMPGTGEKRGGMRNECAYFVLILFPERQGTK